VHSVVFMHNCTRYIIKISKRNLGGIIIFSARIGSVSETEN
jgi:hypothetical protein